VQLVKSHESLIEGNLQPVA